MNVDDLYSEQMDQSLSDTDTEPYSDHIDVTSDDMDLDSAEDENPLLVPPEQDSPSHILTALNDHCLYEAFKRLHFLDLLNVAKVCVRFESQAKAAFASKYKKLWLNIKRCDQNTMQNILCSFGSSVQSLRIDSDENGADGDLFHAIIRNCSSELKKLELFALNIQLDSPNLRLPFPKLEELGLGGCVGNLNLAHLIDDCPDLTNIWMMGCDFQGVNDMIGRQFKNLKKLDIRECDFDIDDNAFEHFIVSNPALIKLAISPSKLRTSRAIRLVGQTMMQLQKLIFDLSIDNIQHFQSDVECIGQLRSLKRLDLDFNRLEVTPLVKSLATNNVPIKSLYIALGVVDGIAIKCISQLKKIKILGFECVDGLNGANLIDLAKKLPELQKLELASVDDGFNVSDLMQMLQYAKKLGILNLLLKDGVTGFTINTDDYKAMVDIIKNRPEEIHLCITVSGDEIKLNVSKEILQEHCDILAIQES